MNHSETKETVIPNISSVPDPFRVSFVTSTDGTRIGYRQIGSGSGLVILHGGLRASQHYERLAAAVKSFFLTTP